MSSVADVDPSLTLTQGNRTYILKRPTFKCEGWIVDWIRQRAFATVETIPDPRNRAIAFSTLIRDIALGKYDWETIQPLIEGQNGVKQWFYFRMMQDNAVLQAPDDGWKLFERVWNDEAKLTELVAKYKAVDGPNPQIPPENSEEATGGATKETPNQAPPQ